MEEEIKKVKGAIEIGKPDKVEITGCTFKAGVFWDKASVEVIKLVAQALLNLTDLFTKQGVIVDIGPAISIGKTDTHTTVSTSKFEREGNSEDEDEDEDEYKE